MTRPEVKVEALGRCRMAPEVMRSRWPRHIAGVWQAG